MAYSNYLLFNNVFLKNLKPSAEEIAAANYLVHESARDWYKAENFTSPQKIAEAWIKPLLNQQSLILLPTGLDENAWYLAAPWDRDTSLALCCVVPAGTDLGGYTSEGTIPKGQHWMIRAVNLARSSKGGTLRWVILTNGTKWRLLDAGALRRYEAYLEVDLLSLLQGEDDPLAAYLFYRLLRLEDALERDETTGRNRLDAFVEQSVAATEETEAYLKVTVSDYLDTPGGGDGIMGQLCMGIVNAIDPGGTKKFADQERAAIYRDATYLLYRLLFILYAEVRNLLPMEREDYQRVSLERIIDEVAEFRTNPHLFGENPTSLWKQLRTLSEAIYYSDEFLGIPAYNGGLFDNQDRPYLKNLAISNVFLAEALYQLAYMPDPKRKDAPERIDYRDLSVRHLGSLYEGMIEYQLFIAEEDLIARQGKKGIVSYLPFGTTTMKASDETIPQGKVYFAHSPSERKATGTHYTPEELVERLVEQTVGRLLQRRWNNFEDDLGRMLDELQTTATEEARSRLTGFIDDQLESFIEDQVLSLRICDLAVGSGHFLVHIAHTLTNFIIHTLTITDWDNPSINLDPDYWRRRVTESCLFGVDINEMAVELAKLSLWLVTMQVGRPLSFLDHHLRPGNSLLGVRLDEVFQLLVGSDRARHQRQVIAAKERGQLSLWGAPEASEVFEQANEHLDHISGQIVAQVEDVEEQESDYQAVQEIVAPYKGVADLLVARSLGLKIRDQELHSIARALASNAPEMMSEVQRSIYTKARNLLAEYVTFHWALEFPKVFVRAKEESASSDSGFDVVIGNPPYLGGAKISTEISDKFLTFIKSKYVPSKQNTDLCAYFVREGFAQLNADGYLGMVLTGTIGEGDTREGGLAVVVQDGGIIVHADRHVKWPGDATVEVALITIKDGHSEESTVELDGNLVDFISSWLDDLPETEPFILLQNKGKSFLGSVIHGVGFLLSEEEAQNLINKNSLNGERLQPYLIGRDINRNPKHEASRQVIYFGDLDLDQARKYPDLLDIVVKRVKPYRDKVKRKQYRENWWRFAEDCVELRQRLPVYNRVLIRSRVSELHMVTFVEKNQVFSDATVVFTFDDYYSFAILQSSNHEIWLRRQASSLRTDIRYTPTDCFQTYPFPQMVSDKRKEEAAHKGENYFEYRRKLMLSRMQGLTAIYNLFHDPEYKHSDVSDLRNLCAVMDQAVLECYGWEDIELDHGFYPNDRGKPRYMPSQNAQREIFMRLLELNQAIAEREAERGDESQSNQMAEELDDLEE